MKIKSAGALGVDLVCGPKVYPKLLKTRNARYAKYDKRKARIRRLTKSNQKGGGLVFLVGILPAVLFDAGVHGLSGQKLLKLRRDTARALGAGGPKRSLDLALAFNSDLDPEIKTRGGIG